jgi:hypothetical protein
MKSIRFSSFMSSHLYRLLLSHTSSSHLLLSLLHISSLPPLPHTSLLLISLVYNLSSLSSLISLTSLIFHLSPLTSHLSSLTSRLSPLTSHLPSLTSLSPLTSHLSLSSLTPSHLSLTSSHLTFSEQRRVPHDVHADLPGGRRGGAQKDCHRRRACGGRADGNCDWM